MLSFERSKFAADWLMERVYIVTMITSTGECVVSKGCSFAPAEGDRLKIKATIKAHDWYREQAQTTLSRVVGYVEPAPKVRRGKAEAVTQVEGAQLW